MCGIAGVVLREDETVDTGQLKAMGQALQNRGPDAEGIHSQGNLGLVHRRLKIIDLSDSANQPMFNANKNIAIVFNGEIYNFKALKAELMERGHKFRTQSDTEVALCAYEEWGTEAFRKFNGMFAMGIWDSRGNAPCTYLVRDRFGIKPLFYSIQQGRLAFASELKPLMLLPWISKQISRDTLYYFLKFSHLPFPQSIYENVYQLRPGEWLRFEAGRAQIGLYWDSITEVKKRSERRREMNTHSEEELLDQLETTLRNVVERQLVSDVPVGCFLSGGIDSSLLVMAYSQLARREPIQTFSIGYKEAEFDETPYAQQVADAFGTDHQQLIVSSKDCFALLKDMPHFYDQPFADPTVLPTLLLARFARQKVTVALSGDGGDELFFGYPHQAALYYLDWFKWAPASIRALPMEAIAFLAKNLSFGPSRRVGQRLWKLSQILQYKNESELYQYFVGTLGPLRMDRLSGLIRGLDAPAEAPNRRLYDELLGLPNEDRVQQLFQHTFLVDTVLTKTDRAGMAYGLEARVPFLDDEMVEFAESIPFEMKYRKRISKYILRKLLARRLKDPRLVEKIAFRTKQGFSIPLSLWLRTDLKYLLDEYLNERRLTREGLFEPASIQTIVQEHIDQKCNHSHLLWSLISFQIWKERYER